MLQNWNTILTQQLLNFSFLCLLASLIPLFISVNLTRVIVNKWILHLTLHLIESYNICFSVTAYFTHHNVLKAHPCCSMCQEFIPFLRLNNIPSYVYATLDIHSFESFHLLATVNNVALNISLQIPVSAFISFWCTFRNCWTIGYFHLFFWEFFFPQLVYLFIFPPPMHKDSIFLYSCQQFYFLTV